MKKLIDSLRQRRKLLRFVGVICRSRTQSHPAQRAHTQRVQLRDAFVFGAVSLGEHVKRRMSKVKRLTRQPANHHKSCQGRSLTWLSNVKCSTPALQKPTTIRKLAAAVSVAVALFAAIYYLPSTIYQTDSAHAAINDQLNFQARLRNSSQAITPDGDYHLRFKIYSGGDGNLGGGDETLDWTETRSTGNLVRVENGYFNVQLGSLTSLSTVDFNDPTLWLSIEIGGNGGSAVWDGEMDPFIRLTATPYAFNSDQLDGLDSGDFVQLGQGAIQGVNTATSAVAINQTGTGSILQLQAAGTDVLTVDTDEVTVDIPNSLITFQNAVGSNAALEVVTSSSRTAFGIGTSAGNNNFSVQGNGDTDILGALTLGEASSTDGQLLFARAANANTITLSVADQTVGSATITIPDVAGVSDTICLTNLGNCAADDTVTTVAANDSSAADKKAADYVADGTADEVEINDAIGDLPAAGGTVVLLPGTFTVAAAIELPNNTTLEGSGSSTTITVSNIATGFNIIENDDQVGGNNNLTIRNLKIDGNDGGGASSISAIDMNLVGSGSGATSVSGFTVDRVTLEDVPGLGVNVDTSFNSTIRNSILREIASDGIFVDESARISIIDNRISNTFADSVRVRLSDNNLIQGNTIEETAGPTDSGITLGGSSSNRIVDNQIIDNDGYGIYLGNTSGGSNNNIISNNLITGSELGGIYIAASFQNIISGNSLFDNQDYTSGTEGSIHITSNSDRNQIVSNYIQDVSDGSHAIVIGSSLAQNTYLADNTMLSTAGISDGGTDTIYANQLDNSGNLDLQPAGNVQITANTDITGAVDITGTLTTSGVVTLSNYDCSAANTFLTTDASGILSCAAASSGAADLQGAYDAGNTITTTDARDIDITLADTTTDSNFTIDIATGSTGRFAVQGNGTDVLGVTSSAVTIDQALTVNATATFNEDLTVAANKSLTLTGGTTANRPASPTEGEIFYDTDTDTLLTYANGKWQADRGEYVIVAANDSTQAQKDAADYVTDGTADQTEINSALTAAAGGEVRLLAGTYVADATILVPNNTTLAGVGRGTLIELDDIDVSDNLIENSDTSTGTGVVIKDLRLDGRDDLNTLGTQYGIDFNGMGGGSGASARQGARLINLWVNDFRSSGILIESSSNNIISSNTVQGNGRRGIYIFSGTNNTISGNLAQGNNFDGIALGSSSNNNTISGNTVQGNSDYGISLSSSSNNTISGNTAQGNTDGGISLFPNSNNNTVSSNTAQGNNGVGILFSSSSNNTASGNTVHDNGGAVDNDGLYFVSADSNTITGNTITDTSATSTNYSINITNAASDNNYLANNVFDSGASINDLGTDTIYAGQTDSSGNYDLQPAGDVQITADTDITGDLVVQSSTDSTTALQVLDADGGVPVFNVDTVNERVGVGTDAPSTILQAAGDVTLGDNSNSVDGNLIFERAANTNTITLSIADQTTGSATITIPDVAGVSDTVCLEGINNCGSTDEIVTVAAVDSAANVKAAADYVADGTADEVEINNAINDSAGGKVVLLKGTFTVAAAIELIDDTVLEGSGPSTVITVSNTATGFNIIENDDQVGGNNNLALNNFKLDGNEDGGASSINVVDFDNVGTSLVDGARLDRLVIEDSPDRAVNITNSVNVTVQDSFLTGSTGFGIFMEDSFSMRLINNNVINSGSSAVVLKNVDSSIVQGNVIESTIGPGDSGIKIETDSDSNVIDSNTLKDVNGNGIEILSSGGASADNVVSNNSISDSVDNGIRVASSFRNTIIYNSLEGNDTAGTSAGIVLNGGGLNSVTGNYVEDVSDGSYAIEIAATSSENYLSSNIFSDTAGINDLASDTIYSGQLDNSGNYNLQPAGDVQITADTNINGSLDVVVVSGAVNNSIELINESTGNGSGTSIQFVSGGGQVTQSQIYQELVGGTSDSDLVFDVRGSGTLTERLRIQNNGTSTFTGNLVVQSSGAAASLTVGETSNSDGSIVLARAANANSITLEVADQTTGNAIITIPDVAGVNDEVCLLNLSNCSVGGGSGSTAEVITVAATDSSAAEKAAADYTADGTNDHVEINDALSNEGNGGEVVLLAGTYTIGSVINVPNNTILSGVGDGTVITVPASATGFDVINNSDRTGTGTNVFVRDLKIDGAEENIGNGIEFEGLGSGEGSTTVFGGQVDNVTIVDVDADVIDIVDSNHLVINNVRIDNSNNNGIDLSSTSTSSYVTLSDNLITDVLGTGINSADYENITIVDNHIHTTNGRGIHVQGGDDSIVARNDIRNTGTEGVRFTSTFDSRLTDNMIKDTGRNDLSDSGIVIGSSDRIIISGNYIDDTGGLTAVPSIDISGDSDQNIITDNLFQEPDETTDATYAIEIGSATGDENYIADNQIGSATYSGGFILDQGTDTVIAGQEDENGDFDIQPAGNLDIQAATNITGNVDITGNLDASGIITFSGLDCTGFANGGTLTTNASGQLQCTDDDGGAGGSVSDLQGAYNGSTGGTTPEIKLDGTRGALSIQDADTSLNGNLFEVLGSNASGLGAELLTVDSDGGAYIQKNLSVGTSTVNANLEVYGSDLSYDPTVSSVQSATGSSGSGAATATLGSTPTEDNLLVVVAGHRSDADTASINGTGWTKQIDDHFQTGSGDRRSLAMFYKVAGASEPTSVTVDWSGNGGAISENTVRITEYSVDSGDFSFDTSTTQNSSTSQVASQSTGTTTTSSAQNSLAITGLMRRTEDSSVSWSNSFSNDAQIQSGSPASVINTAWRQYSTTSTVESTASWTGSEYANAGVLVFSLTDNSGGNGSVIINRNGTESTSKALTIQDGGTDTFSILHDGTISATAEATFDSNVGIGTTSSPANLLSVGDLTTTDASGQFAVSTGGTSNEGVIIQGVASQSADLLQAQDSAGSVLAAISSSGTLRLNELTVSPSTPSAGFGELFVKDDGRVYFINDSGTEYDLTATGAAGTSTIALVPEFAGLTITPDGTNNNGFLTSDFCSGSGRLGVNTGVCSSSTDEHNYYEWTTSQATDQDYDLYIRHQLPDDFSAFTSSTSIQVYGWRTDGTNNSVDVSIYEADGTLCGSTTNVATGTAAWTQTAIAGDETACTFAAEDIMLIKVKLTASQNEFANLGGISYSYDK